MKLLIALTMCAVGAYAQAVVSGLTGRGVIDLSAVTRFAPPAGSSLPGTCTVGDLYFKTSATIGLYTCNTTNNWTLAGGGSGATSISQLTDFLVTATSTVITGNASCGGSARCMGRVGNLVFTFTSAFTATITTASGAGAYKIYLSEGGAIIIAYENTLTLTSAACVGCTLSSQASLAAFPPKNSIPIAEGTASGGLWVTTVTPKFALASTEAVNVGVGLVDNYASGIHTIEIDTADVPRLGGGNDWTGANNFGSATRFAMRSGSALPGTCVVGDLFFKTSATIGLNQCNATDTWTALGGSSSSLAPVYYSVLVRDIGGSAIAGTRTSFPASGAPSGTLTLTEHVLAGFPDSGTPTFYIDLGTVPTGMTGMNANFHAVQQDGGVGSTVARITFAVGCAGDGDSDAISYNTASAVEVVPDAANTYQIWSVTGIDVTGCTTAGKNMRGRIQRVNTGLTGTNYGAPVYGGWGSFLPQ